MNIAVGQELRIDINIATACLEAVGEVVKTSIGSDVTYRGDDCGECQIGTRGYQGKVKLTGDWQGEIILAMSHALAAELTARFVGCKLSELDDESVGQGVGEMANQIAGRAATMLSQDDICMGITVPEISSPSEWHLPPSSVHSVFRFECADLPLLLIVSVISDNSNSGRT